jgi:hypothetical protein
MRSSVTVMKVYMHIHVQMDISLKQTYLSLIFSYDILNIFVQELDLLNVTCAVTVNTP